MEEVIETEKHQKIVTKVIITITIKSKSPQTTTTTTTASRDIAPLCVASLKKRCFGFFAVSAQERNCCLLVVVVVVVVVVAIVVVDVVFFKGCVLFLLIC